MRYLLDYLPKLADWLGRRDLPKTIAEDIQQALFADRVQEFSAIGGLSCELQTLLSRSFRIFVADIVSHTAGNAGVERLRLQFPDGDQTGCTLRRGKCRCTIALSSHASVVNASAPDSHTVVGRSLTSGEILEQILRLQQTLTPQERITHVEFSGTGEALSNLDNVLQALTFIRSATGLAIAPKQITLATTGSPAAIRRLARLGCEYRLVISLLANTDRPDSERMSENATTNVEPLLVAADFFSEHCPGRLVFEYRLTGGSNDQTTDANKLADHLAGREVALVLVPYRSDSEPEPNVATVSRKSVEQFAQVLQQRRLDFRVRPPISGKPWATDKKQPDGSDIFGQDRPDVEALKPRPQATAGAN